MFSIVMILILVLVAAVLQVLYYYVPTEKAFIPIMIIVAIVCIMLWVLSLLGIIPVKH